MFITYLLIVFAEMDNILELLSKKVTKSDQRLSLFTALKIDSESIEASLPSPTSLKGRTKACLDAWCNEQCLKYWKYQELLMTFRDSGRGSDVDGIIDRFKIKGIHNNKLDLKVFR